MTTESKLGRSASAGCTATALTLDDVLEQVEAKWRAWRAEHPDAEVRDHEGRTAEAAYRASDEILEPILRRIDDLPVAFVVDERVWRFRLDSQSDTPAMAIREVITRSVFDHINGVVQAERRGGAPLTLNDLFDRTIKGWKEWRAEHPHVQALAGEGYLTDEASDALVSIGHRGFDLSDHELRDLVTDSRVLHAGIEGPDDTPAKAIGDAASRLAWEHVRDLLVAGELS